MTTARHSPTSLILRLATEADARLLWTWANDATVRAAAFSRAAIPWEQHQRWLADRLHRAETHMYIALANGEPIGQIRFDADGACAVVDVSVAAAQRRRGYGRVLVEAGTRRLFADTAITVVRAYVKPGNEASRRAFSGAGYAERGLVSTNGHRAYLYEATPPA